MTLNSGTFLVYEHEQVQVVARELARALKRDRTRSATFNILGRLLYDPEFGYVSRLRARARAGAGGLTCSCT